MQPFAEEILAPGLPQDSVRQRGGICGVAEVAMDHAATVEIWVGTASINGSISSAMASVCIM